MKSTKKALLMSLLSLVMCMALLLGTTFAWFTDKATSGANKIVAGNLDIELEYSKDMANWNKVQDSTQLFGDVALWEPGATSVVYLRVTNKGGLTLKYNLGFELASEVEGTNVDGNQFKLSDYILFGQVEDVTAKYATRGEALSAIADSAKKISEGYQLTGELKITDDPKVVACIAYMPEDVDNAANYVTGTAAPTIEMAVKLVATQKPTETDSFDDQYDADSKFPMIAVISKDASSKLTQAIKLGAASAAAVSETNPVFVSAPVGTKVDSAAATFEVKVSETVAEPTLTLSDGMAAVAAYDIDMPLDSTNNVPVEFTMYVGKEFVDVYHGTTKMTNANTKAADTYQYDETTGIITMYLTHCSTFTFVYAPDFVAESFADFTAALAAAEEGDTIMLTGDINPTTNFTFEKSVTIDCNGYAFVRGAEATGGYKINLKPGCDLTMKNGTWAVNATFGDITAEGSNGTCNVTFEDMEFPNLNNPTTEEIKAKPGNSTELTQNVFKGNFQGNLTVNASFKNCTFTNTKVEFSGYNGGNTVDATFDSCKFTNITNSEAIRVDGYGFTTDCKLTVTNCEFDLTATSSVYAVEVERFNSSNNSAIAVTLTDNTVTGAIADSTNYVVNQWASVKAYSASATATVTESGTTVSGIATK